MLKTRILTTALASALLIGGYAIAQPAPRRNVSAIRHPNIAAAQRLLDQAFAKITAAQEANEFDLGGHAAKAKELIDQANRELRMAATVSNEEKRR
jgi:hypothetical protein